LAKEAALFHHTTFLNNSANYCKNVASFGIELVSLDIRAAQTIKSLKGVGNSYVNIGSGQRLPQALTIALVDHEGEIVTTDNSSLADISPDLSDNVTMTGVKRVQELRGFTTSQSISFQQSQGQR